MSSCRSILFIHFTAYFSYLEAFKMNGCSYREVIPTNSFTDEWIEIKLNTGINYGFTIKYNEQFDMMHKTLFLYIIDL